MKYLSKLLSFTLCLLTAATFGNDLEINNVSTNTDYTQLSFDVSWKNSWRQTETFHDAVWIFVKFLPDNGSLWEHADITDGNAGNGLEIIAQPDQKGVFIRSSADYLGDIAATRITLNLSIDPAIAIHPDFQVFGMEMVYVPDGAYYLGDGEEHSRELNVEYGGSLYGTGYSSMITDTTSLIFDLGAGMPEVIAENFPSGVEAFYSMKYPFTNEQMVGFLNTLTLSQQEDLLGKGPLPFNSVFIRTTIDTLTSIGNRFYFLDPDNDQNINEADDGATVVAALRSLQPDNTHYKLFFSLLDWSGLRPMSELEYEKACRGPLKPVGGEYAWGNTKKTYWGSFSNSFTDQAVSEKIGSVGLQNLPPNPIPSQLYVRAGHAAFEGATRGQAGATYWGILDMTGNGYELVMGLENKTYNRELGDGYIDLFPSQWKDYKNLLIKFDAVSMVFSLGDYSVDADGDFNAVLPDYGYTYSPAGRGVR